MSDSIEDKEPLPFLPAKESTLFIRIFEWYCDWLVWRRFDSVDLQSHYTPGPGQKTIYFMNHNSWWDGLIPFLLNQKKFRQNARGMMEDKQLHRYPFFRRLGVFSISLSSPRSSIQSLRYAVRSMSRPNASLYIYPQGKIVPFSTRELDFRKGVGWLAKQIPDADLVPVAIYIHTKESDRPKLEIIAGNAVNTDRSQPERDINQQLEKSLRDLLRELVFG